MLCIPTSKWRRGSVAEQNKKYRKHTQFHVEIDGICTNGLCVDNVPFAVHFSLDYLTPHISDKAVFQFDVNHPSEDVSKVQDAIEGIYTDAPQWKHVIRRLTPTQTFKLLLKFLDKLPHRLLTDLYLSEEYTQMIEQDASKTNVIKAYLHGNFGSKPAELATIIAIMGFFHKMHTEWDKTNFDTFSDQITSYLVSEGNLKPLIRLLIINWNTIDN